MASSPRYGESVTRVGARGGRTARPRTVPRVDPMSPRFASRMHERRRPGTSAPRPLERRPAGRRRSASKKATLIFTAHACGAAASMRPRANVSIPSTSAARPSGSASGCGSIPRQSGAPTAARRARSRSRAVPLIPRAPAPAAGVAPSAGSTARCAKSMTRSRSRGMPPKSSRSSVPTRSTSSPGSGSGRSGVEPEGDRVERLEPATHPERRRAAPPRRRAGRSASAHAGDRQDRLDVARARTARDARARRPAPSRGGAPAARGRRPGVRVAPPRRRDHAGTGAAAPRRRPTNASHDPGRRLKPPAAACPPRFVR